MARHDKLKAENKAKTNAKVQETEKAQKKVDDDKVLHTLVPTVKIAEL